MRNAECGMRNAERGNPQRTKGGIRFRLPPPPSAFCLLPSAFCLLPSAFCLLPYAFCLAFRIPHSAFIPHSAIRNPQSLHARRHRRIGGERESTALALAAGARAGARPDGVAAI